MTNNHLTAPLGAIALHDGRTQFLLWAPKTSHVRIKVAGKGEYTAQMEPLGGGYFGHTSREAKPGLLYSFALGEGEEAFLPDPASRSQPHGVHGPSQVVSRDFSWSNRAWHGLKEEELVIYELHVGCFSPQQSFAGILPYLAALKELGVTALEIMPIAQFPGRRNWGYDGVFPFAVQDSYGGAAGFKALINRCHDLGLGVILDVVYNHLGPEGNYLDHFGPYFQDRYKTPWGRAINFDGPDSDHVRRYFINNALQWLHEFRCDGLRLDAIHAILDTSAIPFLEELTAAKDRLAKEQGRPYLLIAESDANDSRILLPREQGGLGLDSQWSDDLHHCLHAQLTGERLGYYRDYGELEKMAKAMGRGVVFEGQYSHYRRRHFGRAYQGVAPHRLVVGSQNHDQIGNRAAGERLSQLVDFERLKLAAGTVLLTPFTPLLFMGEEYGEEHPFLYFVDHGDADLMTAVRKGRAEEFAHPHASIVPADPGAVETFARSRLRHELKQTSRKAQSLLAYYQRLIFLSRWLRRELVLANDSYRSYGDQGTQVIWTNGQNTQGRLCCYFSFSPKPQALPISAPLAGNVLVRSTDYTQVTHPAMRHERHDIEGTTAEREHFSTAIELAPFEVLALWVPH